MRLPPLSVSIHAGISDYVSLVSFDVDAFKRDLGQDNSGSSLLLVLIIAQTLFAVCRRIAFVVIGPTPSCCHPWVNVHGIVRVILIFDVFYKCSHV